MPSSVNIETIKVRPISCFALSLFIPHPVIIWHLAFLFPPLVPKPENICFFIYLSHCLWLCIFLQDFNCFGYICLNASDQLQFMIDILLLFFIFVMYFKKSCLPPPLLTLSTPPTRTLLSSLKLIHEHLTFDHSHGIF